MSSRPEDRRVRRTRRLLREALLALVVEKGYDRVTVQDVLDRADLGRATFYAHFRDKEDLLTSGLAELRATLRGAMVAYARGELGPPGAGLAATRALFGHIVDHRRLYRALVSSRTGAVVVRQVRAELVGLAREHLEDMLAQHHSQARVPVEVQAEFTVGALLGLVTWWLDVGLPYSVDQMAAMWEQLITPALEAALGLTPPPTRPA